VPSLTEGSSKRSRKFAVVRPTFGTATAHNVLRVNIATREARKAESRARGLLRGRGIGDYLEVTGPPANEMGGIRFEPDGNVTIITGTLDYGQGHWTTRLSAFRSTASDCCKATATN